MQFIQHCGKLFHSSVTLFPNTNFLLSSLVRLLNYFLEWLLLLPLSSSSSSSSPTFIATQVLNETSGPIIIFKKYICVNPKLFAESFVLRPASVTIPYHNSCQCLNLLVLLGTGRISSPHSSPSSLPLFTRRTSVASLSNVALVSARARQEVAERWRHYTDRRSSFHENST